MRLVLVAGASLIIALLLRRRPVIAVSLALTVWTIVPGVAVGQVTGHVAGTLSLHAGSWLVLTTALAQLLTDARSLAESLVRRFFSYVAVLLVIAAAVLETKTGLAAHGVVLAFDELAVPFVAFWVLSAGIARRPADAIVLRNVVIGLAVVEAGFAVAQFVSDNVIFYDTYYATRYWYRPGWNRWMGTTDHPLVLSMLLCAAIPLLVGLRRRWLQPLFLILMLIGVVITQSRSGVVAAGIGAIYVVLASRTSTVRKFALIALMAGSAVMIATSALSTGVVDRVNNDTGSALARGSAWSFFADNWSHYVWTGGGITSNYHLAAEGGLDTSFESAFLMYAVDLGVLLALVYFVTQVVIVLRAPDHRMPGTRMAAITLLVLCQTFNSLEVKSLVGPLIWVVLALAIAPDVPYDADEAAGTQQRRIDEPAAGRGYSARRSIRMSSSV